MPQEPNKTIQKQNNIFNPGAISSSIKAISAASSVLSRIKQYSFARQNRFAIEFSFPPLVLDYINQRDSTFKEGNNSERFKALKFNCTRISLPNRSLQSTNLSDSSHEFVVAAAGSIQNTIGISFICFADMKEKVLIDYWMEFIYVPFSRSLMFLEEYSTDITFYQLDGKNNPTYGITIGSAFPSMIQGNQYDHQPATTPVNIDVMFTYSTIKTFDYSSGNSTISSKDSPSNLTPFIDPSNPYKRGSYSIKKGDPNGPRLTER
jgi:hypothetical protein